MNTVEMTEKERDALSDMLVDWCILVRDTNCRDSWPGSRTNRDLIVECLVDGHEFSAEEAAALANKLGGLT